MPAGKSTLDGLPSSDKRISELTKRLRKYENALHLAARQTGANRFSCDECPMSSAFPAINEGVTCGSVWGCEEALCAYWKKEVGIDAGDK